MRVGINLARQRSKRLVANRKAVGINIPTRVTAESAWHRLDTSFLLGFFLWVNVKPRCASDPDGYITFFFFKTKRTCNGAWVRLLVTLATVSAR